MGALLIAELLSQHVCVVPCHGFGFSGDSLMLNVHLDELVNGLEM